MTLCVRPAADQDIVEHIEYIARDSQQAAQRFLQAVRDTFTQLQEMPGIGSVCSLSNPRLSSLRSWRIKGFEKHLVFYRVHEERLEIIRVLHGARDLPGLLLGED